MSDATVTVRTASEPAFKPGDRIDMYICGRERQRGIITDANHSTSTFQFRPLTLWEVATWDIHSWAVRSCHFVTRIFWRSWFSLTDLVEKLK